jgi:hypothetical protein
MSMFVSQWCSNDTDRHRHTLCVQSYKGHTPCESVDAMYSSRQYVLVGDGGSIYLAGQMPHHKYHTRDLARQYGCVRVVSAWYASCRSYHRHRICTCRATW